MTNNFQISAIYSDLVFKVYNQSFLTFMKVLDFEKKVQIYSVYYSIYFEFISSSLPDIKKMFKFCLFCLLLIFDIILTITNLILGCLANGSLVISNGHRFLTRRLIYLLVIRNLHALPYPFSLLTSCSPVATLL